MDEKLIPQNNLQIDSIIDDGKREYDLIKDPYEYINRFQYSTKDVDMKEALDDVVGIYHGDNLIAGKPRAYDPNSLVQVPDVINYQKPPDNLNLPKYNYNQKTYEYKPVIFDKEKKKYRFIINSRRYMDPSRFYLIVDISNENINNFLQLDGSYHSLIKNLTFIHNGIVIERINNYNIVTNFINDLTYKTHKYHNNFTNHKYDLCVSTKEDIIQPIDYGTHIIYNPPQFNFDYTSCKHIVNGELNFEPQNTHRFAIPIFSYLFGNATQTDFKLVPLDLFKRGLEIEIEFNENAFFVPVFNAKISDIVNASINNDDYIIYRTCLKELEELKKIGDKLIESPVTYSSNKDIKNKSSLNINNTIVVETIGMGNCLFEAVALGLFNDMSQASKLRREATEYLITKGSSIMFDMPQFLNQIIKITNTQRAIYPMNTTTLSFNYWRYSDHTTDYYQLSHDLDNFKIGGKTIKIKDVLSKYIGNISKTGYHGGAIELYILSKLYETPIEIWNGSYDDATQQLTNLSFEAIFSAHYTKKPISLLYTTTLDTSDDLKSIWANGHYDYLKLKDRDYGFRGIYFEPGDFFNLNKINKNFDDIFKIKYIHDYILHSINLETLNTLLKNTGEDNFFTQVENYIKLFAIEYPESMDLELRVSIERKGLKEIIEGIKTRNINKLIPYINNKMLSKLSTHLLNIDNKKDIDFYKNLSLFRIGIDDVKSVNIKNYIFKSPEEDDGLKESFLLFIKEFLKKIDDENTKFNNSIKSNDKDNRKKRYYWNLFGKLYDTIVSLKLKINKLKKPIDYLANFEKNYSELLKKNALIKPYEHIKKIIDISKDVFQIQAYLGKNEDDNSSIDTSKLDHVIRDAFVLTELENDLINKYELKNKILNNVYKWENTWHSDEFIKNIFLPLKNVENSKIILNYFWKNFNLSKIKNENSDIDIEIELYHYVLNNHILYHIPLLRAGENWITNSTMFDKNSKSKIFFNNANLEQHVKDSIFDPIVANDTYLTDELYKNYDWFISQDGNTLFNDMFLESSIGTNIATNSLLKNISIELSYITFCSFEILFYYFKFNENTVIFPQKSIIKPFSNGVSLLKILFFVDEVTIDKENFEDLQKYCTDNKLEIDLNTLMTEKMDIDDGIKKYVIKANLFETILTSETVDNFILTNKSLYNTFTKFIGNLFSESPHFVRRVSNILNLYELNSNLLESYWHMYLSIKKSNDDDFKRNYLNIYYAHLFDHVKPFYYKRLNSDFGNVEEYQTYIHNLSSLFVTPFRTMRINFNTMSQKKQFFFKNDILKSLNSIKLTLKKANIIDIVDFFKDPEIINTKFIEKIFKIYGPQQTFEIINKYIPLFFDLSKRDTIINLLNQKSFSVALRFLSPDFYKTFKTYDDILNFYPFNIVKKISNNLDPKINERFQRMLNAGKLFENAFNYTIGDSLLSSLTAVLSKTISTIEINKGDFPSTDLLYPINYENNIMNRLLNYLLAAPVNTRSLIGGGIGSYFSKVKDIVSYGANYLINVTGDSLNKIFKRNKNTILTYINDSADSAYNLYREYKGFNVFESAFSANPQIFFTLKSFVTSLNIKNEDLMNYIVSSYNQQNVNPYHIMDLILLEKMRLSVNNIDTNQVPINYIELFFRTLTNGLYNVNTSDKKERETLLLKNNVFAFNINIFKEMIKSFNTTPMLIINGFRNLQDDEKNKYNILTIFIIFYLWVKREASPVIRLFNEIKHTAIEKLPTLSDDLKKRGKEIIKENNLIKENDKKIEKLNEKIEKLKNDKLTNDVNIDNLFKLIDIEKNNIDNVNQRKNNIVKSKDLKIVITDDDVTFLSKHPSIINDSQKKIDDFEKQRKDLIDKINELLKNINESSKDLVQIKKNNSDALNKRNSLLTSFKKDVEDTKLLSISKLTPEQIIGWINAIDKYSLAGFHDLKTRHETLMNLLKDVYSNFNIPLNDNKYTLLFASLNDFILALNNTQIPYDEAKMAFIFNDIDLQPTNTQFITAAGTYITIDYKSNTFILGYDNNEINDNHYKKISEGKTSLANTTFIILSKYMLNDKKIEESTKSIGESKTLEALYRYLFKQTENIFHSLNKIPFKIMGVYGIVLLNVYQMLQILGSRLQENFYCGLYILILDIFSSIAASLEKVSVINEIDACKILNLQSKINQYIINYNLLHGTEFDTIDDTLLDLENPQTFLNLQKKMQANYSLFYDKSLTKQSDYELLNREANIGGQLDISRNYNINNIMIHTTEFEFKDYKPSDLTVNGYSRSFKRFMIIHKQEFKTTPINRIDLTMQRNEVNNFYQIFHNTAYKLYPTARQLTRYSRRITKYGLEIGSEIYPNNFIIGDNSNYSKCNQFLDHLNKCVDLSLSNINRFNYCLDTSTNLYITKKSYGVADTRLMKFSPKTNLHFSYNFGYNNEIQGKNIIGVSFDYLAKRIGQSFNLLEQKVTIHTNSDITEDEEGYIQPYETYVIIEYDDESNIDSNGIIMKKEFADIQI